MPIILQSALVSNLYFISQLLYRKYSGNFLVNMLGKWKESEYSSSGQSVPFGRDGSKSFSCSFQENHQILHLGHQGLWFLLSLTNVNICKRDTSRNVKRSVYLIEQIIERLKAARQEERAFRDAMRSKRQEMEPVQSTLNRMKNATSVEEFDEKIYQMQYRIEHESMPLREEKQLLRDMKQLKLSRDQLCAIAGSHSELQEAFIHIDKIQERSKLLGQELDSLRKQAIQAEKNVQTIEKELDALNFDFKQLQDQWNAADAVRQEAYEAMKSFKKQEYERVDAVQEDDEDFLIGNGHATFSNGMMRMTPLNVNNGYPYGF